MSQRALVPLILALWLEGSPLAAQRVNRPSLGAVAGRDTVLTTQVSLVPHSADSQPLPEWARGALIGGTIGALGGWLLSGLPCENAPSNCPTTLSSIAAGTAIGAVIGAVWGWQRE